MSENAIIEVTTESDHAVHRLRVVLNGVEIQSSVRVPERENTMEHAMMCMVKEVHLRAYREGAESAKAEIRKAMGLAN